MIEKWICIVVKFLDIILGGSGGINDMVNANVNKSISLKLFGFWSKLFYMNVLNN